MKIAPNIDTTRLGDRLWVMMLQGAQPNTSFLSRGRKTRKVHKSMGYANLITVIALLVIVIKMGLQAWWFKQL